MAKKKVKKKRAAVKTTKKAIKKPAAVKKRKATKKKQPTKKTAKAAASRKKTGRKKPTAKKKAPGKGKPPAKPRPKIPGDAKLYLVFKEDFPARQIFTFLRVETVKELEAFRANEIIQRLTAPVVSTVERIRQRLAENNRHLAGDEDDQADE